MIAAYDAVVAGAGPAGAATAAELAAAGFRVLLLEDHATIGEPLHCSGLVTPRTLDLAGVDDCLVRNQLHGAFVNLSSGRRFAVGGDGPYAVAIDRVALDKELIARAQEKGAELQTSSRLLNIERDGGRLVLSVRHRGSPITISTRLLVGADGAQSRVASWLGTSARGESLVGVSVEAKLASERSDCVEVFVGQAIAPGFFGWLIPLGDGNVRIGIATSGRRRPIHYLRDLIAGFPRIFAGAEFGRLSGGVIPLRRMRHPYADNIMLVGDAAGQVKPTSGGGIYAGLVGAKHCAEVAAAALSLDDVSAGFLRCYEERWQCELGGEFRRMQSLREVFLSLSDAELERLAGFLTRPAVQSLLGRHGDIDYPSLVLSRLVGLVPALGPLARLALRLPWLRPD